MFDSNLLILIVFFIMFLLDYDDINLPTLSYIYSTKYIKIKIFNHIMHKYTIDIFLGLLMFCLCFTDLLDNWNVFFPLTIPVLCCLVLFEENEEE